MGVRGWVGGWQHSPGRPAAAAGRGGGSMAGWGACLWEAAPHIWLGLHSWGKEVLVGARSSGVASIRAAGSVRWGAGSGVKRRSWFLSRSAGCPAPLKPPLPRSLRILLMEWELGGKLCKKWSLCHLGVGVWPRAWGFGAIIQGELLSHGPWLSVWRLGQPQSPSPPC